eukprot:3253437-Pleurochrysis_carterae.AAC.1
MPCFLSEQNGVGKIAIAFLVKNSRRDSVATRTAHTADYDQPPHGPDSLPRNAGGSRELKRFSSFLTSRGKAWG